MIQREDLSQIGKIVNTHGIKGELKVIPLTSHVNAYLNLDTIYLLENDFPKAYSLKHIRKVKNYWLYQLESFTNINQVLHLKGKTVYLEDQLLVPLQEGEFFIHDLIDAKVYNTKKEYLGVITNYFETGANGVCEVSSKKGDFLFPTTQEVLLEIHPEKKIVVIEILEGMLD